VRSLAASWILLYVAGLLEVGWAIGLKYTHGFSKLWPSVGTVAAMVASMFFLAQAVRAIPVGTGYVVWTGIGAVGTAILGVLLLREPVNPLRIASMVLVLLGIVGLRLSGR
jgi:quaternary ammonium compound-resistance protein SugE